MATYPVKILEVTPVTHDVKQFKVERPSDYDFVPGQATDVSINTPALKDELRPFTFTGLASWDHLEFTIKIYSDHDGVTKKLGTLKPGDELLLHDVWGAIHYYDEGTFIAGGAGVTPFIAIFRQLAIEGRLENNRLLFSNKTEKDIILKQEFTDILGDHFENTLTQEKTDKYEHSKIDKDFLADHIKNFKQYFYICGPDPMVEDIKNALLALGAPSDRVITEEF